MTSSNTLPPNAQPQIEVEHFGVRYTTGQIDWLRDQLVGKDAECRSLRNELDAEKKATANWIAEYFKMQQMALDAERRRLTILKQVRKMKGAT